MLDSETQVVRIDGMKWKGLVKGKGEKGKAKDCEGEEPGENPHC